MRWSSVSSIWHMPFLLPSQQSCSTEIYQHANTSHERSLANLMLILVCQMTSEMCFVLHGDQFLYVLDGRLATPLCSGILTALSGQRIWMVETVRQLPYSFTWHTSCFMLTDPHQILYVLWLLFMPSVVSHHRLALWWAGNNAGKIWLVIMRVHGMLLSGLTGPVPAVQLTGSKHV